MCRILVKVTLLGRCSSGLSTQLSVLELCSPHRLSRMALCTTPAPCLPPYFGALCPLLLCPTLLILLTVARWIFLKYKLEPVIPLLKTL